MLPLTFRLDGVDAAVRRLEQALDDELDGALTLAAERVVDAARADHPYTDRTGDLTGSLEAVPASGRFMAGTLHSAATAAMPYAGYVNARPAFRFLQPAFDRVEPQIEQDLEAALGRAVKKAGW